MPAQVTNYQCPSCTGPLHFSGETGLLECDYCGGKYDVAQIERLYADKERQAQDGFEKAEEKRAQDLGGWDCSGLGGDWGADAQRMRAYNCPSCGAALICDDTTAATSCPYCGNPAVVPGQFGGTLRPDYIIPFRLDKNAAVEALKKYYKGKMFLPKSFKNGNRIEEIKGVYVPFWLFDGTADADILYQAKRSTTHETSDERITRTDHFQVRRAGTVDFNRVPVDASRKMPDEHMDSIEPFDYSELRPFSTAYMPGYLADKYDVSVEECAPRADERFRNTAEDAMRSTVVGYDTVVTEHSDVRLHRGRVSYAMLPVWMLNTKWQGRDFLFAMNGQTGKMIGNLPVQKSKVLAWFAGIAVPLMAILALILL